MDKQRAPELLETSGERARFLRRLMGLKMIEMEQKYMMKRTTLSKWETNRNPMSPNMAKKFIQIAAENSVFCTMDWLLLGKGEAPYSLGSKPDHHHEQHHSIIAEITAFKSIYQNAEVIVVDDDSMLPQFSPGDYVGGIPAENISHIQSFFDKPCIIETDDIRKRLRRIGYAQGKIFLYGTNPHHKGSPLFEHDPVITKIIPVFWHGLAR